MALSKYNTRIGLEINMCPVLIELLFAPVRLEILVC